MRGETHQRILVQIREERHSPEQTDWIRDHAESLLAYRIIPCVTHRSLGAVIRDLTTPDLDISIWWEPKGITSQGGSYASCARDPGSHCPRRCIQSAGRSAKLSDHDPDSVLGSRHQLRQPRAADRHQ